MSHIQSSFKRNENILERDVDGQFFLIDNERGKIHALDPFAVGIWRLLENPVSVNDIVAVFLSAFPERQPKEIRRHIDQFVATLKRADLALETDAGS